MGEPCVTVAVGAMLPNDDDDDDDDDDEAGE